MDGIERDTRYNGNFAFNVLGGKEFLFGKNKNKTIQNNNRNQLNNLCQITQTNIKCLNKVNQFIKTMVTNNKLALVSIVLKFRVR